MKKVIIHISIILTFFVIYFLQANFFTWFNLAGIMPNLFVILLLYIGLFMGRVSGITYGVIFGLIIDSIIGKKLGITSIMLTIVGLLGAIFDKNFSKDSRITIMIMVATATILYEAGKYALMYFIMDINVEIMAFIKTLIIETILNVILTIIIYPIMQITGYDIEEKFKENKILTRYF